MAIRTTVQRFVALFAVPALAGAGLAALAVVAPVTTAPAYADIGMCPEGSYPGVGPVPAPGFTDNNVAVFAGGDYIASGAAAESEGLLVVVGDAPDFAQAEAAKLPKPAHERIEAAVAAYTP